MEIEATEQLKTTEPLTGVISLDELKQRRPFLDLTARQQLLIENFILSGGDKIFSVKSAYDTSTDEVARVMSYTRFADASVVEVLNLFFGVTPREALQQLVDRAVRRNQRGNKLTVAEVRALELKCELAGFTDDKLQKLNGYVPKPNPTFQIGDEDNQDGIR
jgi:hypothetical protein